jgi:hypothetical protein
VLGQEVTLNAEIDAQRADRLSIVEKRLDDLEVYGQEVVNATDRLVVKPGEIEGIP